MNHLFVSFLVKTNQLHPVGMARPENSALPPEIHYEDASKYKNSSRLNFIQSKITNIALDLVLQNDETPLLILDLGCGTGMSGNCISERGHFWVGCDISMKMLLCAQETESLSENDVQPHAKIDASNEDEGSNSSLSSSDETHQNRGASLSFLNLDISQDLPFKPGSFDIIVSISCIQWLFHNKSLYEARKSIKNLFLNCKAILTLKGKAVFQFYNSKCSEHNDVLLEEAKKAGFFAEFVTSGKGRNLKTFLLLDCHKKHSKTNNQIVRKHNKILTKIQKFKERRIKKGKQVSKDSKYSGRKRSKKFI